MGILAGSLDITDIEIEHMTKTARTDAILAAVYEQHGGPSDWTESEARAVWDTCPAKGLFDGFEEFMCALIIYVRACERRA